MRGLHLSLAILVVGFLFSALPGSSEVDGAGLLSIHVGDAPNSEKFAGSGMIIPNGWGVSARHVVEKINEEYGPGYFYVTVGSEKGTTNVVELFSDTIVCPDDDVDICFFKLDESNNILDSPVAKPFVPICSLDRNFTSSLETSGFTSANDGVYGPGTAEILGLNGRFTWEGVTYRNLIRLNNVTPKGLSGSPVVAPGTRNVVAVHTGMGGSDQVASPFYNLSDNKFPWAGEEVEVCLGDNALVMDSVAFATFCANIFQDKRIDCMLLQSENTSLTEAEMANIGEILTAIKSRFTAGFCRTVDTYGRQCNQKIRSHLGSAQDNAAPSSLNDLTQFLALLAEAEILFNGARDTQVRGDIFDEIWRKYNHLNFGSDALAPIFESDTALDKFLTDYGFTDFPVSSAFIRTYGNYAEGRKALHQGDLDNALTSYMKVEDVPEFLSDFFDKAVFALELQTRRIDPDRVFRKFVGFASVVDERSDPLTAAAVGTAAIYVLERYSKELDTSEQKFVMEEGDRLWKIALGAPKLDAPAARIQYARFLRAIGDAAGASQNFTEAYSKVFDQSGEEVSVLAATSALHYIATDLQYSTFDFDLDTFFDNALETAVRRANFACTLSNHPDFYPLRDRYGAEYLDRVAELRDRLEQLGVLDCS